MSNVSPFGIVVGGRILADQELIRPTVKMKPNIRLVAIDLDGTLLNSQQTVPPAGRAALQRVAQAGLQIILVSGRGSIDMERILDTLGMDLPYIGSAGSLICSGKNGEVVAARTFHNPAEVNQVIAYARRNKVGLVADLPNRKMCWFGPDRLIEELLDPFTAQSARLGTRTFSPEEDFDRPILKMSIAGEMDLLQAVESEVLNGLKSIHHVYAGLRYMDLTAQGVDKGSALEIFAQYANIPAAQVAAIGDQPIDLPMFAFSGLSIAMGNAPEAIKKSADWITASNDEDGVAQALMKILEDHS